MIKDFETVPVQLKSTNGVLKRYISWCHVYINCTSLMLDCLVHADIAYAYISYTAGSDYIIQKGADCKYSCWLAFIALSTVNNIHVKFMVYALTLLIITITL